MKKEIQKTGDGSHTIFIPELNVTYHSIHGAIQESKHVFINAGLKYILSLNHPALIAPLRIFEMGFGTGLNALLTLQFALCHQQSIYYFATEHYPLSSDEISQLNYSSHLKNELPDFLFSAMHNAAWNEDVNIHSLFTLHKSDRLLQDITPDGKALFHLIYFDAFAPLIQPELWTETIFRKLNGLLHPRGILVTYCSKGNVRRAMQAAGFYVEKLQGPPGKREMLRATKQ